MGAVPRTTYCSTTQCPGVITESGRWGLHPFYTSLSIEIISVGELMGLAFIILSLHF